MTMEVTFDELFTVRDGDKTWTVSVNRMIIQNTSGRAIKRDGVVGRRILRAVENYASTPIRTSAPRVSVARFPSANAPTYAMLVADATKSSGPFVDDVTPAGHFGVVVDNIGGIQTYWLRGDPSTPDGAIVVARTQDGMHYIGGGLLGGRRDTPSY